MGGVGGSGLSDFQTETNDMRVGFGSLASQGFPANFPVRAEGAGKICFGEKDRFSELF